MSKRIALITGAAGGIGHAIAVALAGAGFRIVINDIVSEADGNTIAAAFAADAVYLHGDLLQPGVPAALLAAATARVGPVSVLVNNAGVQKVSPIVDFEEVDWNRVRGHSLDAAFLCTKAALPGMLAAGWGRIINIASAHGLVASPFKAAYVAAKHGLVGLTKATALEVAEQGITANAICPGYVRTPLVEAQVADQMRVHGLSREAVLRDIILASQPTRRFVEPEEVGAMATYLASDAARSITGTAISIDGGWTAR